MRHDTAPKKKAASVNGRYGFTDITKKGFDGVSRTLETADTNKGIRSAYVAVLAQTTWMDFVFNIIYVWIS